MIPAYLSPIPNHLWQSTVFAVAAGLLTLALRQNQARTRYWLWLAASVKFLAPFSVLVLLGSQIEWRTVPAVAQPTVFSTVGQISQPFHAATVAVAPEPAAFPLTDVLFAGWALGFLLVVISGARKWVRMLKVIRAASPLPVEFPAPVKSSSALIEPGVFGILRPALVFPEGIADRLTPAQLEAILAHELCHVRYRDNLAAAIHMLVEAIFWFHPLVWWLGARMVEERERACDEEVLRLGNEPQVYAEGILRVCEFYLESPLNCVAGVTGGSLKKRIEDIMSPAIACRLNIGRKLLLATAGLTAVAGPVGIGLLNAPRSLAQSQSVQGIKPEFDVASIKPAAGGDGPPAFASFSLKRGRFDMENMPLQTMIQVAYKVQGYQITGGPSWISSKLYEVTARAEGNPTTEQSRAMVQTLLADRFKLALHRETKELLIYNLVAAKNGVKLQRSKEGDCAALTPDGPLPGFAGAPSKPCGVLNGGRGFPELRGEKVTMAQLTPRLSQILGHSVIDKAGFSGAFNIHLRWTPDEAIEGGLNPRFGGPGAPPPDPDGPSIFTVLQDELGLRLQSGKGPVEILVIDHVEHPSEN